MSEQDKYAQVPPRNTGEIQKNYNSDAKKIRAKVARARIVARQKAERNARQRAAEHQYVPDQAS